MLGLGPTELIIILVLVVFFYGGRRLGEIGDGLGKSISAFKRAIRDNPPPAQEINKPSLEEKGQKAEQVSDPVLLAQEPSKRNEEETS